MSPPNVIVVRKLSGQPSFKHPGVILLTENEEWKTCLDFRTLT